MVTRIRELLEARQLSPTQFADLIGVGRPVISHILSERNKPSLEVVQKVISAFPEVSLPWLLSGIGTMLASSPPVVVSLTMPSPPLAAFSAPAPTPEAPVLAGGPVVQAPPPLVRPLPPKFRPAAQANAQAVLDVSASSAIAPATVPTQAAAPPLPAPPVPAPPAQPIAPVAVLPPPLQEPLVIASPVLPSVAPAQLPLSATVPEAAIIAAPPAELPGEPAVGASALSFLGEPGKAIRRIVIFYRDGSFSDYVPEG